jgi:hypothetical protein
VADDELVWASEVEAVDEDRTADDVQKKEVERIVKSRQARREGLKAAGADLGVGVGSPDLHDRIESGLEKRRENATTGFKAQQAAAAAVAKKRGKS